MSAVVLDYGRNHVLLGQTQTAHAVVQLFVSRRKRVTVGDAAVRLLLADRAPRDHCRRGHAPIPARHVVPSLACADAVSA
ncbi:MAG: hypothetical protein P8J29_03530 [Rhodospirillales bacterium]|nr:hypothetical protein [Rhodospirillales bacterium]